MKGQGQNRTREIRPSGIVGRLRETWPRDQISDPKVRALDFYPDAANIVEGCGRETTKEYLNFLNIAFASLREAGYYIELAARLEYLPEADAQALHVQYDECAKVLGALMNSLLRKS